MYRDFTFSFLFQLWLTRIAKSLANPSPIPSPAPLPKSKITSSLLGKEISSSSETLDGNESVKGMDEMMIECDCVDSFHNKGHTLFDVSFPTSVKQTWEVWHATMPDFVTQTKGGTDLVQTIHPINEISLVEKGSIIKTQYKIPLGLYSPVTKITSTVETFNDGNICMVSTSRTEDVPYGSSFETVVRVCFIKDGEACRVVATYECVFLNDVNWLVKGMGRGVNVVAAVKGQVKAKIVEFHKELVGVLQIQFEEKDFGVDEEEEVVNDIKGLVEENTTARDVRSHSPKLDDNQTLLLESLEKKAGNVLIALLVNCLLLGLICVILLVK
jgi:hypothetical protein